MERGGRQGTRKKGGLGNSKKATIVCCAAPRQLNGALL
jgi:hypothetical protein